MTDTTQKQNPFAAVGGIAGAVGGFALAQYSGASLLVPGAAAILLLVIFSKTGLRPRYFRGAIALAIAHVVWFVFAALWLGTWAPVVLDIVALSVGVIWLWVGPGLVAAIFVAVIEVISFGINMVSFASAEVGSAAHRGLVVHLLLRIAVLACLVVGYRHLRAEREQPRSDISVEPSPASNA